jgi:hypothetical protein
MIQYLTPEQVLFLHSRFIVETGRLSVANEEMVQFALACAQSQRSVDEIADWFKRFCIQG